MTILSRKEQFIEGFNAVNRWLPHGNAASLRIAGLRGLDWSCQCRAEKNQSKGKSAFLPLLVGAGLQYMQTAGVAKAVEDALLTQKIALPTDALKVYRLIPFALLCIPKRYALVREHFSDLGLILQAVAGVALWRNGQRAYGTGILVGTGITLAAISTRVYAHRRKTADGRNVRLAVGILNKCVVPIITHYKTLSAWKENKAEALLSVGKIGVKVAGNLFKSFIIKSGVNYLSKATLAGRKLIWSIIE